MKPLPEDHFTVEDWCVIVDVVLRCGRVFDGSMFGYWVMERSRQSDRRDAELMLQYVQCTVPKDGHAQIGGECGWFAGQTQR